MRKSLLIGVGAILAMLPGTAHAEDVALDDFLKEVKTALMLIKQDPNNAALPAFTNATVNLSVTRKKTAGGKFKLFILEFGKTRSSEVVSSVSVVMGPPPGSAVNVGTDALSAHLAGAVSDAAAAIATARAGSPPLVATQVKASIKFGVTSDGNGKLAFNLGPAEIGGSGGMTSSGVQEIVVVFGK